jgi:hypothetical protein
MTHDVVAPWRLELVALQRHNRLLERVNRRVGRCTHLLGAAAIISAWRASKASTIAPEHRDAFGFAGSREVGKRLTICLDCASTPCSLPKATVANVVSVAG